MCVGSDRAAALSASELTVRPPPPRPRNDSPRPRSARGGRVAIRSRSMSAAASPAFRHLGVNAVFLEPQMGGIETYVRRLYPAILEARPDLRVSMFVNEHGRDLLLGGGLGRRCRARHPPIARAPGHPGAHRGGAARAGRGSPRLRRPSQRRADRAVPDCARRTSSRSRTSRGCGSAARFRSTPGCSGARSSCRPHAAPTGSSRISRAARTEIAEDLRRAGDADRRRPARAGRRVGRRSDSRAGAASAARPRATGRSCSRSRRCSRTRTSARSSRRCPRSGGRCRIAVLVVPGNRTPLADELTRSRGGRSAWATRWSFPGG